MNYAEKHGNRAAERRFGSPSTEKIIREWRKQRKDLIKAGKSKKALRSCAPKWPKLEEYFKNWIIDERKNGISVSTKMILIETRRLAIEMSITDFAGTALWCERFMRRNGLYMRTKPAVVQKLPCGYERKMIEFHKYVINMRKKLCFEIGQLGNVDEVLCGNKMPTRCNRGFYCRSYCLLNMFRAPLRPSSGAQEYYTMVAACGIWCKAASCKPDT